MNQTFKGNKGLIQGGIICLVIITLVPSCAPRIKHIILEEHLINAEFSPQRLVVLPIVPGDIDPQLISAVRRTLPPYIGSNLNINEYWELFTDYIRKELHDNYKDIYTLPSAETNKIIKGSDIVSVIHEEFSRAHTLAQKEVMQLATVLGIGP